MEMTDDSIDSRLKGIADEVKADDTSIIRKPMISPNEASPFNEYVRKIEFLKCLSINQITIHPAHTTPFKQQKLSAWQPILTANTVLPWLLAIGICFIPLGAILLNLSNGIREELFDYTTCEDVGRRKPCSEIIEKDWQANCRCEYEIKLTEPIDKDVYFYYSLQNFYQNHRRYVRSRNDWQLLGYTNMVALTSCTPFDRAIDPITNKEMLVAPCGAIANSIFNDTFELWYETKEAATEQKVTLLENEISWPTDRKSKFKNPANLDDLKRFTHPINWQTYLQDFKSDENHTAFENEHLIVWMRSAALPNFRKLWARVDHTSEQFKRGLPKGKYKVKINYNFPVTQFDGRKLFILSNTSWLGGKNSFLGFAYIITGTLCIVLTATLFVIFKKFGVRERDMIKVDTNTPFVYSNLDQSS